MVTGTADRLAGTHTVCSMVTGSADRLAGTHIVCSMVTGTADSLAGTHTVMQYGDRNCREPCRHTLFNAVW